MVWLNKMLRVLVGRRWQRIREEYVELVSGVRGSDYPSYALTTLLYNPDHTKSPNRFVEELWDNLLLFRSTKTCFGTLIKYMTS